jgi:methyl-accepting chemotaxis protein
MKPKSLLNRKEQLACGAAILTMLAAATISHRSLVVSGESDQWVRHTDDVLENLQKLLSAMLNVESGSRGMVVTGQESFLEFYRANIASAERYELTVRKLTVDNPAQRRQLPAPKRRRAQKVEFSDGIISLRRAKGLQAATDARPDGTGQRSWMSFKR